MAKQGACSLVVASVLVLFIASIALVAPASAKRDIAAGVFDEPGEWTESNSGFEGYDGGCGDPTDGDGGDPTDGEDRSVCADDPGDGSELAGANRMPGSLWCRKVFTPLLLAAFRLQFVR